MKFEITKPDMPDVRFRPEVAGQFSRIRRLLGRIEEQIAEFEDNGPVEPENIKKSFEGIYYNLAALQCFYAALDVTNTTD